MVTKEERPLQPNMIMSAVPPVSQPPTEILSLLVRLCLRGTAGNKQNGLLDIPSQEPGAGGP